MFSERDESQVRNDLVNRIRASCDGFLAGLNRSRDATIKNGSWVRMPLENYTLQSWNWNFEN
jgi:hypothetical protein